MYHYYYYYALFQTLISSGIFDSSTVLVGLSAILLQTVL